MGQSKPWHQLRGEALVGDLLARFDRIYKNNSSRLVRYQANAIRYERALNRNTAGLPLDNNAARLVLQTVESRAAWNIGQAVVDSATAEIAGSSQPSVQAVTSFGDWSIRRRGVKLERILDTVYQQPVGPYQDVYDLRTTVVRDMALFGEGAVKTIADLDIQQVLRERTPPWQLFFEHDDAEHGMPSCTWHVYPAERYSLEALFPDKDLSTATAPQNGEGYLFEPDSDEEGEKSDRILVIEVWKVAQSKKAKGVHVIVAQGVKTPLLFDEKYEHTRSPIEVIHWRRPVEGMFGTGIMDDVAGTDDELEQLIRRMAKAIRQTAINRTWTKSGTVTGESLNMLQSDADSQHLEYDGDVTPKTESAAAFHPQNQQFAELLYGKAFELSGASMMMVTAQRQPGVESNAALLSLGDLQSKRLSVPARQAQMLMVRLGYQHVWSMRDLAKQNAGFLAEWKGHGYLNKVAWRDVDLEDDAYQFELQAGPSQKGSKAWRIQQAENLFAMGKLNIEQYMAAVSFGDTPGEIDKSSGQARRIDMMIERWLDATPEQLERGYLDEAKEYPLMIPPDDFRDLEQAVVQVDQAKQDAEVEGAPGTILTLFVEWLANAEAISKQRAAAMPQPAPAAPGGPAPAEMPQAA